MTDLLSRRRCLPAGGQAETRVMRDGWKLRSLAWRGRADGPGSILFLGGRADFAEKYAETFHDLVDTGWGVATFDWRGQGLSGRVGDDAMKGAAPRDGFDCWLADLDAMVAWFRDMLPPPWFVIGHSMGGHLLLRHLAGENREFERAVLLAPMLGVPARPLGAPLARRLSQAMVGLGHGHRYVAGGGPRLVGAPGSARQRLLTTDPERYSDEGWWVEANPALALGSPTWGWLAAAFASLDALLKPPPGVRGTGEGRLRGSDEGRIRGSGEGPLRGSGEGKAHLPALQRITTPLLVLIAEGDGLVDNAITRSAVATTRFAMLEAIDDVGHELLREASDIRARVLARVTDFLQMGA